MKLSFTLALFSLLVAVAQVYGKGFHCAKYVVIKHGDRCRHMTSGFSFDKDYYVTLNNLYMYNPTMDCSNLRSGNKICVEINEKYEKSDEFDYTFVGKNETCDSLAKRLKTTLKIIENTNDMKFDCKKMKDFVGTPISYRKDGNYDVIYNKSSVKVNI